MENIKTCCFTGHRPQKLPWGFNENDERYMATRQKVKQEIENACNNGYITFISGMALGFDIMCAEIVIELKRHIHKSKSLAQFLAKIKMSVGSFGLKPASERLSIKNYLKNKGCNYNIKTMNCKNLLNKLLAIAISNDYNYDKVKYDIEKIKGISNE